MYEFGRCPYKAPRGNTVGVLTGVCSNAASLLISAPMARMPFVAAATTGILALDRCSQIGFIIRGMLIILLHRGSVGTDAIAYISRDGWVGLFHNARNTLQATQYSLRVPRVMPSRRCGDGPLSQAPTIYRLAPIPNL